MKLWLLLAQVFLLGNASSQQPEEEVPTPPGRNPFVADLDYFYGGPKPPLMLYTSDFDLWEMVTKVTSQPPTQPPGVGLGIGGPVALLQVVKPSGQSESGFKIAIYPRLSGKETGSMGICRVTAVADHVTEERYLGWFDHKELRALCEAEGERLLAVRAAKKPVSAYSVITKKEGAPDVWVEKLYLVNSSDRPLLIEKATLRVLKAGTTEELRKAEVTWPPRMKRVDGKRQIELLPQRTWLALSTEWNEIPDLATQSCSVFVGSSEVGKSWRTEVNRYIEAEVERH